MLGKTRIESAPDGRRPISLAVKRAGEPSAGNRHARFEVAGVGNQLRTYGAIAPVPDPTGRTYGATAPVPDPYRGQLTRGTPAPSDIRTRASRPPPLMARSRKPRARAILRSEGRAAPSTALQNRTIRFPAASHPSR